MRRKVGTRRLQTPGLCLPGVIVLPSGTGLIFLRDAPGSQSILPWTCCRADGICSAGDERGDVTSLRDSHFSVALLARKSHRNCRWPRVPLSLPAELSSLSHLLCFLSSRFPSLLLLPGRGWSVSPVLLLSAPSTFPSRAAQVLELLFPWQWKPAPDSRTFIPGMSLHRSTAVPSSGQKPQVTWPPKPPESLKSWCGHPGWGQRRRAGCVHGWWLVPCSAPAGFHRDVTVGGDTSSLLPGLGDREGLRGFTIWIYPSFLFQEHCSNVRGIMAQEKYPGMLPLARPRVGQYRRAGRGPRGHQGG
ncbi:hypothetical protein Nmel_018285, partial [Mimus melanotis]